MAFPQPSGIGWLLDKKKDRTHKKTRVNQGMPVQQKPKEHTKEEVGSVDYIFLNLKIKISDEDSNNEYCNIT